MAATLQRHRVQEAVVARILLVFIIAASLSASTVATGQEPSSGGSIERSALGSAGDLLELGAAALFTVRGGLEIGRRIVSLWFEVATGGQLLRATSIQIERSDYHRYTYPESTGEEPGFMSTAYNTFMDGVGDVASFFKWVDNDADPPDCT